MVADVAQADSGTTPRLFSTDKASDLLKPSVLSMLMLGFTAGLGTIAVALQDRHSRYDLYGPDHPLDNGEARAPGKCPHWASFCRFLRHDLGQDAMCLCWDRLVACRLLGVSAYRERTENPRLAETLDRTNIEEPFLCHAGMMDMAALISIRGRPFAVLHGGQIQSRSPNWDAEMRRRLAGLCDEAGLKQAQVDELVAKAESDRDRSYDAGGLRTKHEEFEKFAMEVQDLLTSAYENLHRASQGDVLSEVAKELLKLPPPSSPLFWDDVARALDRVRDAARLERVAFLQGDADNGQMLRVRAAAGMDARDVTVEIADIWEDLTRHVAPLGTQPWVPRFGALRGEGQTPAVVSAEQNPRSLVFLCGEEARLHSMRDFASRLGETLASAIRSRHDEERRVRAERDALEKMVMAGHKLKSALHAAVANFDRMERCMPAGSVSRNRVEPWMSALQNALADAGERCGELQAAGIDDMKITIEPKLADVMAILRKAVELASGLYPQRGISVSIGESPPEVPRMNIDADYLRTAFDALLENAAKYSYANKEVWVRVEMQGKWLVIEIEDFGLGIPEDKRELIFEFGKRGEVDDRRGPTRAGYGLGLPYAQRVIQSHGGTLELNDRPARVGDGHTVTATIRLPIPEEQKP